jgi:hypothetical protein
MKSPSCDGMSHVNRVYQPDFLTGIRHCHNRGAITAGAPSWSEALLGDSKDPDLMKKGLVFFCHFEECLNAGFDLAGISLRIIGLDLEEGYVPVLCKVILEHA